MVLYDFEKLHRLFDFNSPPDSITRGFTHWLFIHPTPREVWQFWPTVMLDSKFKHADVHSINSREMLRMPTSELSVKTHCSSSQRARQWIYYPNDHVDFQCCMTRVTQLIGIEHKFTERYADPYKVGVLTHLTKQILTAGYRHGTQVVLPAYEYDFDQKRAVSYLESIVIQPQVNIIIMWWSSGTTGHVAYFVEKDYHDSVVAVPAPIKQSAAHIIKALRSKFPPNRGRAGGKVMITIDDIYTAVATDKGKRLAALLLRGSTPGWEAVSAVAVILLQYLEIAGDDLISYLEGNQYVFNLEFVEWVKFCKDTHSAARVYQELPNFRKKFIPAHEGRNWARHIYGFDIIGGRSELLEFKVTEELLMRTTDPATRGKLIKDRNTGQLTWDRDAWPKYLDSMVSQVTRTLIVDRPSLETLERWYARRFFWAPSGGAPGAKISWLDELTGTEEKVRLNKRGALIDLPFNKVSHTFDQAWRIAAQWSVEALKFESAKMRGILNTGIYPFLAQGYILSQFDTNVHPDTWFSTAHGNTARIANSIRRLTDMVRRCALMWDYSDFNINHIFLLMILLYQRVAEVLLERGTPDVSKDKVLQLKKDFSNVLRFIIQARLNTYIRDNEHDVTVQARRSLQSGERGTSFVNSLGNEVSSQIVIESAARLLNMKVMTEASDKLGDDLFTTAKHMIESIFICCLFNLTGSAGQVYKITSEWHHTAPGHGEYLRLAYNSADHTVSGYPLRGMMGFIHGEFFIESVKQPFERVATILEQVAKLKRRGWLCPQGLLQANLNRNAHLVFTDASGNKHVVTGTPQVATTPAVFGGLGVTQTADIDLVSLQAEYSAVQHIAPANSPHAMLIPSGEGKTTLASKYDFLIDHDSLVNPNQLARLKDLALATNDWRGVNRYLREAAESNDDIMKGKKLLLTWSPESAPATSKFFCVMLTQSTGLRANLANRRSIINTLGKSVTYVKHRGELTTLALGLWFRMRSTSNYLVNTIKSDVELPRYAPPRVDSKLIARASKLNVIDYQSLRKYGIPRVAKVDQEIIESSLQGAFPRNEMNESLARYARELEYWQKSITVQPTLMTANQLISIEKVRRHCFMILEDHLAILPGENSWRHTSHKFTLNESNHPKINEVKHMYGSVTRLVRLLGFSTSTALTVATDGHSRSVYPSGLGRLYGLLEHAYKLQTKQDRLVGDQEELMMAENLSQSGRLAEYMRSIRKLAPLKLDNENVYHQVYMYLKGELNFVPPVNNGWSSELTSFCRSCSLHLLESNNKQLLALLAAQPQQLAIDFFHYESIYTNAFLVALNTRFPGITLRD